MGQRYNWLLTKALARSLAFSTVRYSYPKYTVYGLRFCTCLDLLLLMLNQVKTLLGSVSRFLNTSSNSLLRLYKVLTSAKLYTSDNVIIINKPSDLNQLPNNSRLKDIGFDGEYPNSHPKDKLVIGKTFHRKKLFYLISWIYLQSLVQDCSNANHTKFWLQIHKDGLINLRLTCMDVVEAIIESWWYNSTTSGNSKT